MTITGKVRTRIICLILVSFMTAFSACGGKKGDDKDKDGKPKSKLTKDIPTISGKSGPCVDQAIAACKSSVGMALAQDCKLCSAPVNAGLAMCVSSAATPSPCQMYSDCVTAKVASCPVTK